MRFLVILTFLTLVFASTTTLADDCLDWFKDLNLKSDSECLSNCLSAPTGMGTFLCAKRCKEFCKALNTTKNPSKQEVIDYITQQCAKKGLPSQIGLTIAWMESKMIQLKGDHPFGNQNKDKRGRVLSTDWGIMQLNDQAWKSTYDLNKIKNDWKYNIDTGIDIAKKSYDTALLKDRTGHNEGDKGPNDYNDNLAAATYSGYNAGMINIDRYRTGHDERDKIFGNTYKESPWRD